MGYWEGVTGGAVWGPWQALALLPRAVAEREGVLPLLLRGDLLVMLMTDPQDRRLLDEQRSAILELLKDVRRAGRGRARAGGHAAGWCCDTPARTPTLPAPTRPASPSTHPARQLGRNLLLGNLNLLSLSMPVRMFESRSYLQKLTDVWVYPRYLAAAAEATDPVERLKLVATWCEKGGGMSVR